MSVLEIDLSEAVFRSQPHSQWSLLREAGSLHRDASGAWLVVRYEPVSRLLRDPRLGKDLRRWSRYDHERPYGKGDLVEHYVEQWMRSRLPSRHAQWRNAISEGLTQRVVAGLRPQIEQIADELLNCVPSDDTFDFMDWFARPFPLRVIASVMGLVDGRGNEMQRWTTAIGRVLEPSASSTIREEGDRALQGLVAVLEDTIDRRRIQPGHDLLSRLIAANHGDVLLTTEELVATVLLLFLSGNETSANLIANGRLALFRTPAEAVRLRERPGLMPLAVEEILRYDGPACIVVRATYAPVEIDSTTVPEGELVLLVLAAANRDPSVFADPDHLNISRQHNPHLAFGVGRHHCIGSSLARLQASVALDRLIRRYPDMRHDDANLHWMEARYLRGLERMMVSLSSGADLPSCL